MSLGIEKPPTAVRSTAQVLVNLSLVLVSMNSTCHRRRCDSHLAPVHSTFNLKCDRNENLSTVSSMSGDVSGYDSSKHPGLRSGIHTEEFLIGRTTPHSNPDSS